MKEFRIVLLWALLMAPLSWSVSQGLDSPIDGLNRGLGTFFLGGLPLLGLALFFSEDFRPKTAHLRFGGNRRVLAFRVVARAIVAVALISLLGGALLIVSLRGLKDPLLLRDLLATGSVALAASVSSICALAAARAWFGKAGLILLVFLGWLIGQSTVAARLAFPSGHIQGLLGLGQELPFAGWISLLSLYAIALLSLGLVSLRVPR